MLKLILIGLVFVFASAQAKSVPVRQVTIPVNVAYSADSLWTAAEIQRRFDVTKAIYKKACRGLTIDIQIKEIVRVEEPNLQDLNEDMKVESIESFKQILSKFKSDIRPTLLFARKVFKVSEGRNLEFYARAFTLEGPRTPKLEKLPWNRTRFTNKDPVPFLMGNIDWNRFEELRFIHGVAILGQAYSERGLINKNRESEQMTVDAHELGHILLNDSTHRFARFNIMGNAPRTRFDNDQCKMIENYHQEELGRTNAVQHGIQAVCTYAQKHRIESPPTFCR